MEKKPNFVDTLVKKCSVTNSLCDCRARDSPLTCAEFTKTFIPACKQTAAAPCLFQMHPQCHSHGRKLPRVTGLVWQGLAVLQWPQQVHSLGRGCARHPCRLQVWGRGRCWARWHGAWWPLLQQVLLGALRRCCATLPRGIHHGEAESPTPSAATIEGLCVSQHKVRIDAVSPPPPVPSRAANGSHKGALLPLLRMGCWWAEGDCSAAPRCGLEHPPPHLCWCQGPPRPQPCPG